MLTVAVAVIVAATIVIAAAATIAAAMLLLLDESSPHLSRSLQRRQDQHRVSNEGTDVRSRHSDHSSG